MFISMLVLWVWVADSTGHKPSFCSTLLINSFDPGLRVSRESNRLDFAHRHQYKELHCCFANYHTIEYKQNRGLQLIQEVQDLLNSKQFQPKVRKTPVYRRNNITKRNSQVDRPATPCKLNAAAAADQKTTRSRRSRRSLVDCKPATRSNNFPVNKVPPRYRSLNRGCMPHGAALASQAYEEAKLQSSNVESQDRGQANACSALTAPSNFAPCNPGLRKMRSKSCNPASPCCTSSPCNQGQPCCKACDGVVQIPKPAQICNNVFKPPCAKPPKCGGRCRMAYVQPAIPESFKPLRGYCPPTIPLAWDTVYTMSYPAQPMCGRVQMLRPENNLQVSGCFTHETTQAHDYQGCMGEPAKRIWPCSSLQVGEGPMQDLTTIRHDYVPKMITRLDPIYPVPELLTSDKPMSGDTTMTASYRTPPCTERVTSYKPILAYKQPDVPFIGDTIHRLSYVPQPICEKEYFPWAEKPTYKCPEVEVEGNTIYKASFRPPGRYVPCGTCPPCNECCPSAKQDCCKATCFDPCCPGVC